MKKILAILLAAAMVMAMFAGCQKAAVSPIVDPNDPLVDPNNPLNPSNPSNPAAPKKERPLPQEGATYTYNYSLSTFPSVWNPHTYQTEIDSDITDYITAGFYTFDYNDAQDGFKIVPQMAIDEHPIDITADYVGKFGVKEGDTEKVYKINLRSDLKWENGDKITAYDFVESAKRLLRPDAYNYRADSLYTGDMVIVNAMLYAKQGQFVENQDNSTAPARLTLADFTKNADGVYVTAAGETVKIALGVALDWLSGDTLSYYVNTYGSAYFDTTYWANLSAAADAEGCVPLTDETLSWLVTLISGNPNWGESADDAPGYFVYDYTYNAMDFNEVGVFALSETELCIAIEQPLKGFYLKYSLSGTWLVHIPTYDACTTVDEDGIYVNTYCTTKETTMSYGPYKLDSFEMDKQYTLSKNANYFDLQPGYYWTTNIVVDHIADPAGKLAAFNQGKLDSYGLTKEDMETYSTSKHRVVSTGDSVYAMTFNPDLEALTSAQAAAGENINKTILTLVEFRQAMSFAMDRAKFCLATSPTNGPAFGLYSKLIISDPDNGTVYRNTDVAKDVLAKFWGVDNEYGEGKLYEDIDEAIDSITGYNLAAAKQMFNAAYDKAIAQGLMDENDVIQITVGLPSQATFYTNGFDFIVNNYTEAVKGTKLEGKLTFNSDNTIGNNFSDALQSNQVNMLFGVGWTGSALNPYSLMQVFVDPNYQYDASTDMTKVNCTVTIDGKNYTTSCYNWYEIMNGKGHTITADDGTSLENFSCGAADENPAVRLAILGALEGVVLLNYNFVPLMDASSASLRGMQIKYETEDYVFGMGFGGLKYYTYNYTDAEWDAFVASQGGTLNYT